MDPTGGKKEGKKEKTARARVRNPISEKKVLQICYEIKNKIA